MLQGTDGIIVQWYDGSIILSNLIWKVAILPQKLAWFLLLSAYIRAYQEVWIVAPNKREKCLFPLLKTAKADEYTQEGLWIQHNPVLLPLHGLELYITGYIQDFFFF